MRILIIENREEDADLIRNRIHDRCPGTTTTVAMSRDSARQLLDTEQFDLLICDLRIPTVDGGLDEDADHGWAVLSHCEATRPGTPAYVLTGTSFDEHLPQVINRADKQDVYGTGVEKVIHFFRKDRITECLDEVVRASAEREALCSIEVTKPPTANALNQWEKRVIQIYCRRRGAKIARTFELGGGLSGSRIVGFETADAQGNTSRAVVRLAHPDDIEDEHQRYSTHIVAVLPGAAYATYADKVAYGAGGLAGIFYELMDGYDRTLFEVLAQSPTDAAMVVKRLRASLERWPRDGRENGVPVATVRGVSVSDDDLDHLADQCDSESIRELESKEAFVHWCRSHRDLHGANVLVDANLTPVIIDYGEVGEATASLDPVVLEFSVVFHPDGVALAQGWPTVEQARSWADLDAYLEGCPFPDFIKACREWAEAVAAGEREHHLTVYSHALRQAKYGGVTTGVVEAIVNSAVELALADY